MQIIIEIHFYLGLHNIEGICDIRYSVCAMLNFKVPKINKNV